MMLLVAGWGLATLAALLLGFETIGGLLALIHLGGLVGAPLAMILNRQLRSIPVVIALSVALSIALSAVAVQSLIWFRVASGPALVLAGTVYGCVLAGLLQATADDRYEAA